MVTDVRSLPLATFALVATLFVGAAAQAQPRPSAPRDFVPVDPSTQQAEHKRKGEMAGFGEAAKIPEKPFPWMALGLAGLVFLVASPFAVQMMNSTNKDLEALKTTGRNSEGIEAALADGKTPGGERIKGGAAARRKAKPEQGGADPRDKVWEAVSSVPQWVPVSWVAQQAGVGDDVAEQQLAELADEGYVEGASDKAGKPIFRVVPT